jgi:hypothetical protein
VDSRAAAGGTFAFVVVVMDRSPLVVEVDERAARRTLREQIARLELELALTGAPAAAVVGHAGPRLLGLRELEETRDALIDRLRLVRGEAAALAERHAEARELLEDMLEAPEDHKWVRVSNEHLGEPGCKHYHSRPRYGIVGMLLGWWRVKISSGCPLATAPPDGAALPQARGRADRRPAGRRPRSASRRSRARRAGRGPGFARPGQVGASHSGPVPLAVARTA